jgi:RNA polymerase sigma factor (sigma-70 family)
VADADGAFERFVRQHATSLLRTAWLLTGERAAAEDLLQDTFTRLYPKWSRVTGAQAPLAYVRRCLLNEYLGGHRRRSPTVVEFLDADDGRSVSDIGDGVATHDATMRLLRPLPERQRVAVILRFFHEMPDADIAAHLGCR